MTMLMKLSLVFTIALSVTALHQNHLHAMQMTSVECGALATFPKKLAQNEINLYRFLKSIYDLHEATKHDTQRATLLLQTYLTNQTTSLSKVKDQFQQTVLHLACITNKYIPGDKKIIETILMAAGCKQNELLSILSAQNAWGSTVLHLVATNNRINVIKLFIQAAGDHFLDLMLIQDINGHTPLERAQLEKNIRAERMLHQAIANKLQGLGESKKTAYLSKLYGTGANRSSCYQSIIPAMQEVHTHNSWI